MHDNARDIFCEKYKLVKSRVRPTSGVVSGTMVRALVLDRFIQKKLKIELKVNAKK